MEKKKKEKLYLKNKQIFLIKESLIYLHNLFFITTIATKIYFNGELSTKKTSLLTKERAQPLSKPSLIAV